MNKLKITSPCFINNGLIPKKYTSFGRDVSPSFNIDGVCENAVSLAITMDDLDIPICGAFNHWVIWNIPKVNYIAENISCGANPKCSTGNAVCGIGWGKNRYRGSKQPFFIYKVHRYCFQFYALDLFLDLDGSNGKKELLKAIQGHILQTANLGLSKKSLCKWQKSNLQLLFCFICSIIKKDKLEFVEVYFMKNVKGLAILLFAILLQLSSTGMELITLGIGVIGLIISIIDDFKKE